MIKNFDDFLNETTKYNLTFKIENGIVNVFGKKYTLFDFINQYSHLIEYVFAIHDGNNLEYFPNKKTFINLNNRTEYKVDINDVVFKTVKVLPDFITGIEIGYILKSNKNVVEYKINGKILNLYDINDEILKSYNIDYNTGKLNEI
jgi:hypothetical protein